MKERRPLEEWLARPKDFVPETQRNEDVAARLVGHARRATGHVVVDLLETRVVPGSRSVAGIPSGVVRGGETVLDTRKRFRVSPRVREENVMEQVPPNDVETSAIGRARAGAAVPGMEFF